MKLISTIKTIAKKVHARIDETIEALLAILERILVPDSLEALTDLETLADYPKAPPAPELELVAASNNDRRELAAFRSAQ